MQLSPGYVICFSRRKPKTPWSADNDSAEEADDTDYEPPPKRNALKEMNGKYIQYSGFMKYLVIFSYLCSYMFFNTKFAIY